MEVQTIAGQLIQWGLQLQVQDLYVLPLGDQMQLMTKKAGQTLIFKKLSFAMGRKLIAHFKFVSGMDVNETRKVQLGAVNYQWQDYQKRLRLSSVGDYQQRESLVIRLLHSFEQQPEHYFLPYQLAAITKQVRKRGLYLFCGPVGSGKTTFMYHLARKRSQHAQVISIEDPVEVEEPSFLQLQTNPAIQLTYDALITACLRHHPDILIIGEIRDSVTAQAAVRAALTGHQVLATIHARSIKGIYQRLLDLGVGVHELREALSGCIYQRLLVHRSEDGQVQAGLLFDYDFEGTFHSSWEQVLRKVWAYGFITNETFQQEQN